MPGSGKSTIARLTADALGRNFFDADAEIEKRHGATCAEIITTRGEDVFRELETDILTELLTNSTSAVIAAGGGAVLKNAELMRRRSVVVYLTRPLTAISDSLSSGERPLSRTAEQWQQLYAERHMLYEASAHITVTNDDTPELAAERAAAEIHRHLKARLLVINGPNLNLLGTREPDIYGSGTYSELLTMLRDAAAERRFSLDFFQSNHEGVIIDALHDSVGVYDGIVINPGAYTHYSYAIYDALLAIGIPAVEVHISNITTREPFRRTSVTAPACIAQIHGEGFFGYIRAMDTLLDALYDSSND
jgi:3-dehydroquinate dehydratase-2